MKKSKKLDYPYFNGWDWSELADEWGVYIPNSYAGVGMCDYAENQKANPDDENSALGFIDWSDANYERFEEYDPIVWYITKVLRSYDGAKPTRVMKKMANDVRCFARMLGVSEFSYTSPLWLGLSQIEDDWSVLSIISGEYPLIATMWD